MTKQEKKLLKEALKMCGEYNWHDETSMRFALSNVKNFLEKNFDIGEKDGQE
tara:strand:+ start:1107 stop:1262 length:156 start_codon:yes stop_codon:yes gene_type:complete